MGAPQVVMGAHFGGNALAELVALAMCLQGHDVKWVPTTKNEQDQQVVEPKRSFEAHLRGKAVLVVDDVSATGGSPGQVVQLGRSYGARVIGVSVIASYCDNDKLATGAGVRRAHSLHHFQFQTYEPSECPQCAAHEPIVIDRSLGHGWEFQRNHPDYPGGFINLLDE